MITAVSLRAAQDCANTAHTARIFAVTIRPPVSLLPISEVSKIEERKMATNSMIAVDKYTSRTRDSLSRFNYLFLTMGT